MKKIEAYVKPFKLSEVKQRLSEAGVEIIRVAEAHESGHQKQELVHGAEFEVDFTPKSLVVVLVDDDSEAAVVRAIQDAARTGHRGDGHIIVTSVDGVVSVDPSESRP